MKKLLLNLLFAVPLLVAAQLTYTGGPSLTNFACKTVWAQGDTIFMGANSNLYRTFDGGANWSFLSNGIPPNSDPRTIEYSNGVLAVGTNDNNRLYTSTDWGDNFTIGTNGITGFLVPTASTSGPNSMFIGGTTHEPYRYDFTANSWVATIGNGGITHGLTQTGNDTVWQCTGGITAGVTQYSYDNGVTWTSVTNEPIIDAGGGVMIAGLAQDFIMVGSRIFVATNLNGFPYLYSDDLGVTWSNTGITGYTWSKYGKKFIKINDNHLLAVASGGIWKSTDQATTWTLTANNYGAAYSIVKGKGDHILIAYANGLLEFDDYGEGSLIKKHQIPSSASNLVLGPNNNIWAASAGGVFKYTKAPGSWSLINDEYFDLSIKSLSATYIQFVGDTLYACGDGLYISGDNGTSFTKRNKQEFIYQSPSMIKEIGSKIFLSTHRVWPGWGNPETPKIWYSTNGSVSYTESTFSNPVSWGLGGGSANYIQEIYNTPTALIADMSAGYAISTDDGLNWTFSGDQWAETKITALGSNMYKYSNDWIMGTIQLDISSDNGATWNALPLTGLPNSSANPFYGIFETNGKVYTYNTVEAPYGLYVLDANNTNWTLVTGTEGPTSAQITGVYELNGELFVNFTSQGSWSTDGTVNSVLSLNQNTSFKVFPNPSTGMFRMEMGPKFQNAKLLIFNTNGQLVWEKNQISGNVINTQLPQGVYVIQLVSGNQVATSKLVIE